MAQSRDKMEQLAEAIAKELFIDAFGGRADRLALMHKDGPGRPERMGSGWCERAVVEVILKGLRRIRKS